MLIRVQTWKQDYPLGPLRHPSMWVGWLVLGASDAATLLGASDATAGRAQRFGSRRVAS